MSQALLDLASSPAVLASVDRTGFNIGWDHARHGLVPPAELLLDGTPLGQGWRAGKAVFGRRPLATRRATRLWLELRTLAWRRGTAYGTQLTPEYLAQIHVVRCPVLRTPLGGAAGQAAAAVVDCLNPQAGYVCGNVAVLSQQAAEARRNISVIEALRRSHQWSDGASTRLTTMVGAAADASKPVHAVDAAEGLGSVAWLRLAVLRSFATKLPFHEAARLPLALLPPSRVRLLNVPQRLQTLLTLQFTTKGWSTRTRSIAALLPEHTLRQDFNLFVGALAPRVLEATPLHIGMRSALEDAWLNERVQRRWQHLVFSLGEAATSVLLERSEAAGMGIVGSASHDNCQAVEGWALGKGHQPLQPRLVRPIAKPSTSGLPLTVCERPRSAASGWPG